MYFYLCVKSLSVYFDLCVKSLSMYFDLCVKSLSIILTCVKSLSVYFDFCVDALYVFGPQFGFWAVNSMPYAVEVLSKHTAKLTSCGLSPARSSMSSPKQRLVIVLEWPPMLTVHWWFSKASVLILSTKKY